MTATSVDTFFNGRLQVRQSRNGYRFSIDAVLLAYYARPRPGDAVLDLGTGCGIIPLIIAYRHPDIRSYGIELQTELAHAAAENVRANHMTDRITIMAGDMKTLTPGATGGLMDLVTSNPPYRKSGSGRINPDSQRAVARHEIHIDLDAVVGTAARMLRVGGKFVVVYPAERLTDLMCRMRDARIEPKLLRTIHSVDQQAAKLIIMEGVREGRPGLTVASPLSIYRENGTYTPAVEKMFRP